MMMILAEEEWVKKNLVVKYESQLQAVITNKGFEIDYY